MADNNTENGLPLLSSLDLTGKEATDPKSQSDFYLANVHFKHDKYGDGASSYLGQAKENGLGSLVYNHQENPDAPTYVDRYNKDGSAILNLLKQKTGG